MREGLKCQNAVSLQLTDTGGKNYMSVPNDTKEVSQILFE
jgi:hypothetical protein